jgi:hypothetical protein
MNALKKTPEAQVPQVDTANQQQVQGMTEEQIIERIKREPGFADTVLQDLDALEELKKTGALDGVQPSGQPAATPEQTPAEQQPAEGQATPQQPSLQKVTVEIDPSHLGTYAKNRPLEEAVFEAVRGNSEKDRLIGFFRNEKIPQYEQRIAEISNRERTLRQEFEDYKKRIGVQPQATPAATPQAMPQQPSAKIEIPEIPQEPVPPEGADFLDDDKRNEYLKNLRTYHETLTKRQKAIEQLAQQSQQAINSLSSELAQVREGVTKTQARVTERDTIEAFDSATRREYAEIDAMIGSEDGKRVFGANVRPSSEIEKDWLDFLNNLAIVTGIKGGIYSDGTNLKPELLQRLDVYDNADSPEGKTLRDACGSRGFRPPDDIDVLNRVYTVRNTRNKYSARDAEGNLVPIPYEKALLLSGIQPPQARQPAPAPQPTGQTPPPPAANQKLMQQVDLSNRRAAAVQKQGQFANEPPVNGGASAIDVNSPAFEQLFRKAFAKKAPEWTEMDKEVLRQAYRSKGIVPEELFPQLAVR